MTEYSAGWREVTMQLPWVRCVTDRDEVRAVRILWSLLHRCDDHVPDSDS